MSRPTSYSYYNDFFAVLELNSLKKKSFKDYKPIIISVGILGTFIGIFAGLWNFDTADITKSVPKLLEGLKLAFITSIFGMFFAVILSFIENITKQDAPSDTKEILQALLTEQKHTNKNTTAILHHHLRSTNNINSQFKMVNETLKKALEQLSKGATEEIIQALKAVISDFNTNLKEQFGENFKQLNESVKNMILWQENYKTTIKQLEQSLQKVEQDLQKICNKY